MRRNPFFIRLISLLLALSVIAAVSVFTAYAVGEEEGGNAAGQQTYENQQEDPQITPQETPEETPQETPQDTPQETPQDTPQETPQETPEETPQQDEPTYAPIYEYINGYSEDMTSAYEAPRGLVDLPAVSSGEVVEATAVVIPEVAVSDASMLSGIVMWLCVALGIAVIVGVLVSKRTRRRGA